jgi:acetyl esterase/lipase
MKRNRNLRSTPSVLGPGAARSSRLVLVCLATMFAFPACLWGTPPLNSSIPLWPAGAPGALGDEAKDRPQLILYVPPLAQTARPAIVILPGGGYGHLAMDHEGHEIAAWCNSLGIAAVIVDYRHRNKGYGHPAPLQDAQRAVRTVRAQAADWGIDTEKIGVLGFSAGGHLASSTGVHFDEGDAVAADLVARQSSRPDFLVLCYPVIAFGEPHTHVGSQRNLLGEEASDELIRELSSEKQVTERTPPTFLWHTTEDRAVPPENSIEFYLALRRAGVPAALHIFETGRHGLGLASDHPSASHWPALCEAWLKVRGILR